MGCSVLLLQVAGRVRCHGSLDLLRRLSRLLLDCVLSSGEDVSHDVERLGREVRGDGGGALLGREGMRARGDQSGGVAEVLAQVQTLTAAQVLNEKRKDLTPSQSGRQRKTQQAHGSQLPQSASFLCVDDVLVPLLVLFSHFVFLFCHMLGERLHRLAEHHRELRHADIVRQTIQVLSREDKHAHTTGSAQSDPQADNEGTTTDLIRFDPDCSSSFIGESGPVPLGLL